MKEDLFTFCLRKEEIYHSYGDKFFLFNKDSLQFLKQIPDESIDVVFADPPYFLSEHGYINKVRFNKRRRENIPWDKKTSFSDSYEFHKTWITECKRILKKEGTIWISGTYHNIFQCGYLLQSLGFHILNDICWYKPNAAPNLSCTTFAHSHETLLWARKDKNTKHYFNYELMKELDFQEDKLKAKGKQMRSVWSIPTPLNDEKKFGKHPTQKPLALLKRILLASTKENDVILDPFNGGGTTAVASLLIGKRYYIGIDIEKSYLDLTIKRIQPLVTQTSLL